ncbi:MAG TPA: glycosyltransferase [Anaerolineaceae bacterium]|nr:glycosyltransferase [Anaerolineaceae bacterium]
MAKRLVRILILTADAGFGHRSAANAVAKALKLKYQSAVEVRVENPLDLESAPFFLREAQTDYDRWVKQVPELYKLGYQASDAAIPTRLLEDSLAVLLFEAIRDTFSGPLPDVVLTTYPMYQSAIMLLYRLRKIHIPLFTVVTDLSTVHRLWFNRNVDGCLVPNEIIANLAAVNGVPQDKVHITGIPVSPDILYETRPAEKIRAELGWHPELTTILAVGSTRTEKLLEAASVINHYGSELQLVVVAGKNEELYQELNQIGWHIPVQLFDFVDKVPLLMKASDLVICKAGGLIVTEALACGLPTVLTDIIPGQETGNAELIQRLQAGVAAETPLMMMESLHHFMMNDKKMLRQYADNARTIGKPAAACDVAEILYEAGKASTPPKASYRARGFRPAERPLEGDSE